MPGGWAFSYGRGTPVEPCTSLDRVSVSVSLSLGVSPDGKTDPLCIRRAALGGRESEDSANVGAIDLALEPLAWGGRLGGGRLSGGLGGDGALGVDCLLRGAAEPAQERRDCLSDWLSESRVPRGN